VKPVARTVTTPPGETEAAEALPFSSRGSSPSGVCDVGEVEVGPGVLGGAGAGSLVRGGVGGAGADHGVDVSGVGTGSGDGAEDDGVAGSAGVLLVGDVLGVVGSGPGSWVVGRVAAAQSSALGRV